VGKLLASFTLRKSPGPAPDPAELTNDQLLQKIKSAPIPRHVAIIMDGNGRWAKKRGLPRLAGHKNGADSVREIVRVAGELKIEVLTLYAFSTENWQRPAEEVEGLMRLLVSTLKKEVPDLNGNNVRLAAVGRLGKLPADVQKTLAKSIDALSKNTGLLLNLALNYGGRQEIVDAANALIAEGKREINEDDLSRRLYTRGLPDPDLLIRTSGELRLSNFLLWQCAYSEIYVTPRLWPEFRRRDLYEAVLNFQSRHRRFGAL
jgi:undecaprenyl diphosphate synthase